MDHLAYRKKFGVLAPSTNTIVQPDYDDMRVPGVTNHHSRIVIPNLSVNDDAGFLELIQMINKETLSAIDVLYSGEMDYIVMGMSATTFWGGRSGAEEMLKMVSERAEVGVSCGSFAVEAALNKFGAKRIAFFSPYFPVANDQVRRFFSDCGFTVVRDMCMKRPSFVKIAHTTDSECLEVLRSIDGDDVDAIVQVGTNLSFLRMAEAAEKILDKPVIAINAATYWHALRASGIHDKVQNLGSLLAQH